jgi:hypothetical protein
MSPANRFALAASLGVILLGVAALAIIHWGPAWGAALGLERPRALQIVVLLVAFAAVHALVRPAARNYELHRKAIQRPDSR